MRVGIGLPNTFSGTDRDGMLTWARLADEGPFSSVGVLDRLVYDSQEPMITLAAVAGVTSRVRLATTIIAGPLRNTAVLAKEAATLDVLSGGRLTLGLALGAREEDYQTARVDYRSRGSLLTEQLAALRSYWEDESFGPKPVQSGGPELLVGGLTDRAFARVARYADGYVYGGGPPRAFGRVAAKVRAAWTDTGRPQQPRLWAMSYYAFGDEGGEKGANYLRDYYAFTGPFAEKIAAGLLTTPQAIAHLMRGYEEEGCNELLLFPTVADTTQLKRLADIIG